MCVCIHTHTHTHTAFLKVKLGGGDQGGRIKDMELTSSHRYIKNTSTCGTVLTEYPLNTG